MGSPRILGVVTRNEENQIKTGFYRIVIPYERHYNPRFVFFLPHFSFSLRFILQTIYVLKNGNSSIFKPKIRGLYMRAVTDQERVIMARVR